MENRHSVLRRGLMPKRLTVAVFTALYVAGSGLSHSSEPHGSDSALPLSFGGLSAGHEWAGISQQVNEDAVVILGAPSSNDAEPGVAELGVADDQLQIRFREWDYLDGKHAPEQMGWLMAKPGTYKSDDGTLVEVGRVTIPKREEAKRDWIRFAFNNKFPKRPHLFVTPQNSQGDAAFVVRAKKVKSDGFSVAAFEQEANGKAHAREESVAYVAIYAPSKKGTVDLGYGPVPFEIKKQRVRMSAEIFGRQLKVEEEQSKDEETKHTRVTASVMLIDGQHLFAQDVSGRGGNTFAFRYGLDTLAISTLKVVQSRTDSVDLAWSPAAGKGADTVVSYQVLRDDVPVSTTAQTHFTDAGLTPDSAYQYKINGLDAEGAVIVSSAVVKASTGKEEEKPVELGAPQSLKATAVGSDQASLSWQAPATGDVTGYKVYRNGKLVATTVEPKHNDSDLTAATTYRYHVVATDGKGNSSAASNTASVTTAGAADTTPPTEVSSFRVSKAEAKQISMTWAASTDDTAVAGYEIWRDTQRLARVTTRAYLDKQVDPQTLYVYKVRAYDKAGNLSGFSTLSVSTPPLPDTKAPTVPAALKADVDTKNKVVRLSWNTSTDNVFVSGYEVMRNGQLLTVTASPGHADTSVKLGETYSYKVRAFDDAGNKSANSNSATAELKVIVPPKSGAELAKNCVSCHGANGISKDPNSPTLAGMDKGYFEKVMASYKSGKRFGEKMKPIAATYKVDEISRMAGYFASLNFKPAKQQVNLAKAGQGAKLHQANCNSCHSSDGQAMNNGTLAGQWKPYMLATLNNFANGKSSDAPAFMINKVKGMSAADREAMAEFYASHGSDTQAPAMPSDLAVATKTETSVTLTWTDADDNASIKHYVIEREGKEVATADQNTFTDTGLKSNTTYNYNIYSVDAAGNRSIKAASLAVKTKGQPVITDPNITHGKSLWSANSCAACHGDVKAFTKGGTPGLLKNSIATNKGGMSQFASLSDQDMADLTAFIKSERSSGGGNTGGGNAGGGSTATSLYDVTLLSNEETLRKAMLVMAGRLPTAAEYQAARNEEGLRKTLRNSLKGDHFTAFVNETMYRGLGGGRGQKRPLYTAVFRNKTGAHTLTSEHTDLFRYIVINDRPYTDVLTADYTALGSYQSHYYGKVEWIDGGLVPVPRGRGKPIPAAARVLKVNDWEGKNTPWPHSGLLSTPSWLNSYPTTHSNRNRHRVSVLFNQFLGIDIESLAGRVDDSDIDKYHPILTKAPACTSCHAVMDPVTATFQDRGNAANPHKAVLDPKYVSGEEFGLDPATGKQFYQEGDKWYRDQFEPGYNGKKMPGGVYGFNQPDPKTGKVPYASNNNGAIDSTQWLAREMVKDPRFGEGTAKFWYTGLFGRKYMPVPNPSEVNYAERKAMFDLQQALFKEVGAKFMADPNKNVKDLLVNLALSDLYRANTTQSSFSEAQSVAYSHAGANSLLSSMKLHAKIHAVVGRGLSDPDIYGNARNGITPVMYTVAERSLLAAACSSTSAKDQYPVSDINPETPSGEAQAREHVRSLYWLILGRKIATESDDVDIAFRLYKDVYALSSGSESGTSDGSGMCRSGEGSSRSNRGWSAVRAFLMTDVDFFTE